MASSFRSVLVSLTLAGVVAGGLVACGTTANSGGEAGASATVEDIGETLATVNGVKVGSKEFLTAAERKSPASGDALSPEEKKEVLDGLVEEKLLYAEALKEGLDKDPKVQKVMVNTLLREQVYSTVKNSDFTDEVLQKYYDDHKSEFIVPEKVQIRRILIKVTDARPDADAKAEAEKLRKEVSGKPDTFKDVAAKFSEDMYKRRGGDVGFVSKEGKPGLDQAIVEKAFALETGAISEVFKTGDGYNVIQVATRREQVERTFQQMKGSVLRKVKNDKMKELYDAYITKIKAGAEVKVEETKLAAIEVKATHRGGAMPGMPMLGGAGEEGEEGEGEAAPSGAPEGAEGAAPAGASAPPTMAPPAVGAPGAVAPGGLKKGG